jgi:hypothetical protein
MTASGRIDDVFDPSRLRDFWVPAPAEPAVETTPGEPPPPPAIALWEKLRATLARDLPGKEAALVPALDRLKSLLLAAEPKSPEEKPDPKALEAVGKNLESLEDLVEALMLAKEAGV